MKTQELRQLTPKQLWKTLQESRHKLAVDVFHINTGKEKDLSKARKNKKTIAKILTILNNERTKK